MFSALARLIYRKRKTTLVASSLFLVAAIAMVLRGGPLTGGTFGDNEAEHAAHLVEQVTGKSTDTTLLAIFHSDALAPDSAAFRAAMSSALAPVRNDPDVQSVLTPDTAPPQLAGRMENAATHSALAFVSLRGTFKEAIQRYAKLRPRLQSPSLQITCTGRVPFMDNFDRVLKHDLVRAELVSLPLALLVLLLAFRTTVAAALPVGVGGLSVVGGIAIVLGLSHVVDIAEYTINVCSLIGLGVAIDYSLFTVSRYREELAAGHDYEEALARALDHAGRVVCFSGLAVATGLVGLLFFNGSLLWAMGVGGILVVLLAVIFALTFLPALLAVLERRIHAGALPMKAFGPSEDAWRRAALWVMERPVFVIVAMLTLFALMSAPALKLELTAVDVRVLGLEVEARQGYETLKRDFPELGGNRVVLAVEFPDGPALTKPRIDALYDFAQRVNENPQVDSVEGIVSVEGASKAQIETALLDPPSSLRAEIEAGKKLTVGDRVVILYATLHGAPEARVSDDAIRAFRKDRVVGDGTLVVGGQTASDLDATEFVSRRTPHAILFVTSMTFVILFFLFGSIVIPLKAMVMNALSVSAAFGALVWVFQEGHLGVPPRPIEHGLPILLFCVLFGLSMDYEVLMLSRIKESYERTKDNTHAVAEGLAKTAGIITSAAAIMIVVFLAFALAKIVLIRAMGFGMSMAVFIDATLVRLLVVPATMRLFGAWNWWAPSFLQKLRHKLGFH